MFVGLFAAESWDKCSRKSWEPGQILGKEPICVGPFCRFGRCRGDEPYFFECLCRFFFDALTGEETCFLHWMESWKNFYWRVYIHMYYIYGNFYEKRVMGENVCSLPKSRITWQGSFAPSPQAITHIPITKSPIKQCFFSKRSLSKLPHGAVGLCDRGEKWWVQWKTKEGMTLFLDYRKKSARLQKIVVCLGT